LIAFIFGFAQKRRRNKELQIYNADVLQKNEEITYKKDEIEAPRPKNSPDLIELPGFNIRSETDQILKQIKLLINEKKVSYRDICIVTPDSDTYAPVLRNKSSRY
jgi:ATP-dependent helicase/DNAse subunit B